LLQHNSSKRDPQVLFGDIHAYSPYGIKFQQKGRYKYLPITKVWTGR
jgi:hypothetical protein